MRQFKFKKNAPNGLISGICRIHEKFIFFKYEQSDQAKNVINEFKKKGISVETGKGWIKIDLLKDYEEVKLKDVTIDTIEDSLEEIEIKLFNFYINQYKSLGFYVE
jgi:hypothetical protein